MMEKDKQKKVEVSFLAVYPKFVSLCVGEHLLMPNVTILPEDASNKTVLWHSEDESVAGIHPSGQYIYGKRIGNTRIYATAEDGCNYSDCLFVVVREKEPEYVPVSSICITPGTRTLRLGCSTYIFAKVLPANATNRSVLWSSDDVRIATIHPVTGLIYTRDVGSTVIRARAQDGKGAEAICRLVVQPDSGKEDAYGS